MNTNACEPVMYWDSENLVNSFRFFKQRCKLYFSVKNIPAEKQVDHILLLVSEEGLRRYNTWTFENDSDRADPEIIWRKFEERLEPQVNFRMARFCLREYKLKNTENIDDFVARYKLQVKKCKFRDNQETEERLIEQIITGTRHPELQKLLLPKGIELTLQEALNSGRTHEASFNHMKQMAEIQGGDSQEINTIKRCGNTHGYQKGKCPAWATTCSACGKKNHWAKMYTNKNENERFAQASTTHNPKQPHEIQNKERNNRICAMNSDTREPSKLYREFEQLMFVAVQLQRDNRTEIFTELQIRLPDRPCTHILKAKVDRGAEGITLLLRTFRRMFPDKVDDLGQPIPGSTKKELTILTAYNSSSIMQHG